ncbi:serine hydrolase domain-containing protein [[Bacillus] enclensis]|uniref:serine hydrolase domain-containing protein n=1 Tax=[Bacillus] enclensis TaxID=1402860 RepID=UPI0018DD307E|nr:serine hydrolase domain-containing protein [[Bacillus] enclensis]MBH9966274.1 beta-lactamase family protein [[Bacillus] enclensis]
MKLSKINIEERMQHYYIRGLSLATIKDGQMSATESYGVRETGTNNVVDPDTVFNACSMSKFVTGMLVMILTDKGVLDLDAEVNEQLLTWKVPHHRFSAKVTLRRLLSHQSGIMDPDDSFSERNLIDSEPSMVDILEGKTVYCKTPIEVNIEPGSEFHYSDAGYCIIQQVIEDVTGKPFGQVSSELIFTPLKMEHSSFPTDISKERMAHFSCGHNRDGQLIDGGYSIYPYPASSGLWTTPEDLGRLIIELIDSLNGQSKIGLTEMKAAEMLRSQDGTEWAGLGVFKDGAEEELEISSLGWGIGFQSMMVAYPHLKNGLIIMTNTDTGLHQLKGIIGEVYHSMKKR